MADGVGSIDEAKLTRIEPEDRLVVLARTIQAEGAPAEAALQEGAANWSRFGETCLGQALYRHRSIFQTASEAPVWSHLELSYFRDIVPADAVHELVFVPQRADLRLLRAEILLTTPLPSSCRDTGEVQRIARSGRPLWNISMCALPLSESIGRSCADISAPPRPGLFRRVRSEPSGRWRRRPCFIMTRR